MYSIQSASVSANPRDYDHFSRSHPTFLPTFKEVSVREYNSTPSIDDMPPIWLVPTYSGPPFLSSPKICNGITIFAIEMNRKTSKMSAMSAHSFSHPDTKYDGIDCATEERISDFLSELKETDTYLYLMGSVEKSAQEDELLSAIYAAVDKHFGNRECIVQKRINVTQLSGFKFMSAILRRDCELNYCLR